MISDFTNYFDDEGNKVKFCPLRLGFVKRGVRSGSRMDCQTEARHRGLHLKGLAK